MTERKYKFTASHETHSKDLNDVSGTETTLDSDLEVDANLEDFKCMLCDTYTEMALWNPSKTIVKLTLLETKEV